MTAAKVEHMIATIDALRTENAELRGRALDDTAIEQITYRLIQEASTDWLDFSTVCPRVIRDEIAKRKDAGKEPRECCPHPADRHFSIDDDTYCYGCRDDKKAAGRAVRNVRDPMHQFSAIQTEGADNG